MDLELLTRRARIFRQTRAFFDRRNYLEVDTPLLSPDLIPETCLEVFETSYLAPEGSKSRENRPYWLIPSPEIWMKKLIADHRVSLYQLGKSFRNGESVGRLHSPEFTMLEYYTMDADYEDSLGITEALFETLLEDPELFPQTMPESGPLGELRPPFVRITVEEAFSRWAGFDLYEAVRRGTLEQEARKLGLEPPPGLGDGALYDLIFIHRVEPALPRDRPVALLDYPAFVPCLAQKKAGGMAMERWELYVRGIELANCYSEERDSGEVRRYFEREAELKNRTARVPHRVDGEYWKTFLPRGKTKTPFPRCSGVAMGMDRLVMALEGKSTINGVLPFPME
ncbi:MAG: LysR family transcriptional regulator [Spirochaetaceae bacterium]|jgi:lysyl-tRNA synthetase class 2|nr:LysR family transcriptional regulator [Spirochaetaceae bacterium]